MHLLSVIALALGLSSLTVSDAPLNSLSPTKWQVRAGDAIEVQCSADDVKESESRLVMRMGGAQTLVPLVREGQKLVGRKTATTDGTLVAALASEQRHVEGRERIFRYEKVFVAVTPKEKNVERKSSAGAMARFGHLLVLTPLVDPSRLILGCDLPVKLKYEGGDLANADVVVRVSPVAGGQALEMQKTTDANGLLNLRIDRSGLWTLIVERRADGDQRSPQRILASMSFVVAAEAEAGAGK